MSDYAISSAQQHLPLLRCSSSATDLENPLEIHTLPCTSTFGSSGSACPLTESHAPAFFSSTEWRKASTFDYTHGGATLVKPVPLECFNTPSLIRKSVDLLFVSQRWDGYRATAAADVRLRYFKRSATPTHSAVAR